MPAIFFIRHGQTDWNAEARLQGQADTGLNGFGLAQARRNGEKLAALVPDLSGFDFVASPLTRTRQTMEIVRDAAGLPPTGYRTDSRLVELHFGDWQGSTLAEIEAGAPGSIASREADKWHFLPPGAQAETYEDLAQRFRPWLDEVDRPTVCVTHGGVLRSVFRLTAALAPDAAARLDIPQDRILRCADGQLDWL